MVTDYNNARGHLTDVTRGYTAGNPVFIDNLDPQEPDVWIVETGSSDENVLNFLYGFPPCSSSHRLGPGLCRHVLRQSPARSYGQAKGVYMAFTHW